jgi:RNA polymerase sigma factor (sigma-70 family)
MTYCLVPHGLAPKVARLLERSWRDDSTISVVIERRVHERRTSGELRGEALDLRPPMLGDRRRIRYLDGRRLAERRAILVPVAGPSVPRVVRKFANQLTFVEALQPPPEFAEGIESAHAIVRLQAGDESALEELYNRYFDRIYTYLRVNLRRSPDAEDRTREVFFEMVQDLPQLALSPAQIEPWLFGIAHRIAMAATVEIPTAVPAIEPEPGALHLNGGESLEWLSDEDLQLLIERRPAEERHLLMLRYMAGLGFAEIGTILGLSQRAVSELHRVAIDSLDASLAAITRSPHIGGRHHMVRVGRTSPTPVIRERRRALLLAA